MGPLLIRTDSTFARTTQLDNHLLFRHALLPPAGCPIVEKKPMPSRHRFLEPIHNVKEGRERPNIRGRSREILVFIPGKNGGAYRDRTDDLKLAKLALSQLSYGPIGLSLSDGGPSRS